jgi:hypothetical protein
VVSRHRQGQRRDHGRGGHRRDADRLTGKVIFRTGFATARPLAWTCTIISRQPAESPYNIVHGIV